MSIRNVIVIFIIASVTAVAVFGFLGMSGHNACIAATFEGLPACPAQGAGFGDALFHIETFKSFSQAVSVAAIALLVLSVLAIALVWFGHTRLPMLAYAPNTIRREEIRFHSRKHTRKWFSLHEKRDPDGGLVGA